MSHRSVRNIGLFVVLGTLCCVCALWGQQAKHSATGKGASEMAGMGPIVRVSNAGESIQQVWAFADPADARHLIVCGMFDDRPANSSYGYVYSSSDDGVSWRRTLLDDSTRWVSEENCTFGKDGRAYFAAGESDTSTGHPRHEWGHLQLFYSQDHGETWKPAGRREFVDWTILVAMPADKLHPERLAIFGNNAADREGHWNDQRPVALDASDNGKNLSGLTPATVSGVGSFGGGAVALSDGTALFLVSTTEPKYTDNVGLHRQLNVYAYTASSHNLSIRSTLRNVPGRTMGLWTTLAKDTSSKFHGRIYAAWSDWDRAGAEREGQLWLATSDDDGYHWTSRPIFSIPNYKAIPGCAQDVFGVQPDIRIAVNDKGALGVLWMLHGRTMQFAESLDGGRTFRASSLVVNQPPAELSLDGGVGFNEWWLAETFANIRSVTREEMRKYLDPAHLGLSVRLSKRRSIGDFALTVGAGNTFHALWAAENVDGYGLMTRSIDSTKIPNAERSAMPELTPASIPLSPCEASAEDLKVESPSAIPDLQVAGQTDISDSLNLHVDHIDYSSESHVVTATVSLTDKDAKSPSLRPVSLVALGLHSDFGVATPLNADGTVQGQPSWSIKSSTSIQLRFKIDQFHVVHEGDAVAMLIRVFANQAGPAVSRLTR